VSPPSKVPSPQPSAEELETARELVRQARTRGVALTGPSWQVPPSPSSSSFGSSCSSAAHRLRSCDPLSVLHGFRDLVDPRVDRGDGLLEGDAPVGAGPCGREVGPPVLMGDSYARPCAFGPSERTGINSTSRKYCLRSNPKFEQRGAVFRPDQVTEQQEVDDVAGPVVDRRRPVMWIGACR